MNLDIRAVRHVRKCQWLAGRGSIRQRSHREGCWLRATGYGQRLIGKATGGLQAFFLLWPVAVAIVAQLGRRAAIEIRRLSARCAVKLVENVGDVAFDSMQTQRQVARREQLPRVRGAGYGCAGRGKRRGLVLAELQIQGANSGSSPYPRHLASGNGSSVPRCEHDREALDQRLEKLEHLGVRNTM
jgi:hypothetical protein